MSAELPALYLKRREDRRIRNGHPWVFSNEVDIERSPLTGFSPGQSAELLGHDGRWLANAYVNPHSLICARVVSRVRGRVLDRTLLAERVGRALALRERIFGEPCYRAVFGEGDELPGLVVDRYGDVVIAQLGTAGMEAIRETVIAVLDERLRPQAIVLRNDVPARRLEGLDMYVETPLGAAPEHVELRENGARFAISPLEGQKTGWYLDHRLNRRRLADYAAGARVLDVFSYTGAWAVQAACAGAREALCIDNSESALEGVRRNAALNGVAGRVSVRREDAFDALRALHHEGRRFDLVVLDPPAFIRRRRDVQAGMEAYRRLNRLAMRVLDEDGVLISASCSTHLRREKLLEAIVRGARRTGRSLQILEEGRQGPDHPVHPALSESAYLKVFFVRTLSG